MFDEERIKKIKMISKPEDQDFLALVIKELAGARAKFPNQDTLTTLAALTEEVGELNQAVLQNKAPHDIMMEAVQVAAMALRVANDCGLVWSEGIEADWLLRSREPDQPTSYDPEDCDDPRAN
jgi:NTP pyrophosphatase (non-canonical NTP hydrolase)